MSQVDEQRNPRTRATANQLLDRHFEMLDVQETTLDSYEGFARNHIRPLIGNVPVGRINGEVLDSFTASSLDVARIATASVSPSTARRNPTTATSAARHPYATRSQRRRSARFRQS